MLRENRLLLSVFAVILLVVAIPFVIDAVREALQPRLVEVRIVSATDRDPVLRDGPRTVAPGEEVTVSLALRLEQLGRDAFWLATSERLVLDRSEVADVLVGPWPGDDPLRVFWFTVECPIIAGELTEANAAERLAHRLFLAPEMGGGVTALDLPQHHADDSLGRRPEEIPFSGGTSRLYARVEVVAELDDVRALAVVTSAPPERALEPDYPALRRQGDLPPGLHPAVGELFRLPGFEPRASDGGDTDRVPVTATGLRFAELVRLRAITSSASFAAVAMTGEPEPDQASFETAPPVQVERARLLANGRRLTWGTDVEPGDALLVADRHWLVLVADDGDGELGLTDRVAHCWRRPPTLTRLGLALSNDVAGLKLIRRER